MSKDNYKKIWLSSPHMGGNEINYVNTAFETNWIAPLGPNVDGFENDINKYLQQSVHTAALTSGTAAIHLALVLLGVGYGDEVICQSMTFSATANPIVYQGATPIFIDSDLATWNMDVAALEIAIKDRLAKGKKPKAIVPVHLYGMPANMPAIMAIANEYEIPVIEDAAEALGSTLHGQKMGTFGEIGILSFNGNKIITTSGGGALVSNNEALVQKARFLSTQARDNAPHYQHSAIGYNYRLSNISAGIGRGQMEVIDTRVAQRRANYQFYKQQLSELPGINFYIEPAGYFSNRWLTTITVNETISGGVSRETIRLALDKINAEARPLWKPMHLQPIFKDAPYYGENNAEMLFNNGICLPSGSNLLAEELLSVTDTILNLFN